MRPLRGLIICEDPTLRTRVEDLLKEGREVDATLVLNRYPDSIESARRLNLCRPEVVLLVIERLQVVLEFLKQLESSAPGIPIIGISRLQDARALTELMRLGMRDYVAAPINTIKFHEAIHRIASQFKESVNGTPVDPLVSFVPVRGGSGASTLACNISHTLSKLPDARVILVDLDTTAGLSRFLFKLTPTSSFGELVESGGVLNSDNWRQCVVTSGHLDIVHGGRLNPRQVFTAEHMAQFLASVSGRYSAICADLTGGLEAYSLELLRRSRLIQLVTTTDTPSIQLAREKLTFLTSLDFLPRIHMLLTMAPEAPPPPLAELQASFGVPIDAVFDFGEKQVRRSLQQAGLIEPKTQLGKQISVFSRELNAQLADTSGKVLN